MGTNAATLPGLDFAEASNPREGYERQEVCRMTIPSSPHPMYLGEPRGEGEAELQVCADNSTRHLEVTDAVQYVPTRWPENVRVSPWTRVHLLTLRRREMPIRLPGVVERILTKHAMSNLSTVGEE